MAETEGFERAPQPVDIANYSNPPKSYAHIYAHTSAKCPVIRPKSIRCSRQRAGGRETGRRSCSANTPSCQSPAKPLPPVRTGHDKTFSEAPQQVRGRGRSRRMVGDSLHISLELPLRPLVTNSGCRRTLPGGRVNIRVRYPGPVNPLQTAPSPFPRELRPPEGPFDSLTLSPAPPQSIGSIKLLGPPTNSDRFPGEISTVRSGRIGVFSGEPASTEQNVR